MTKTDLIHDLRSRGFTKRGAKTEADNFIKSMRFAGLLFEIGNEFWLHDNGAAMTRLYDDTLFAARCKPTANQSKGK